MTAPLPATPADLPLGPIIADVAGLSLTDDDRQRLLHPLIGGVILFSRNFASREQLAALVAQIKALRTPSLLVSVDHEGGRVQRFRDGLTEIPAMRDLGDQYDADPEAALREARRLGAVLALELRELGVDYSYTPVIDLDWGRSGVIGRRAFHGDPKAVAALVSALMHGLRIGGMANCGKHFPGHGWAEADSHVAVPIDERSLDDILQADAMPYRWVGSPTLTSVMPAHVIYPQVDDRPAGFSKIWLQDVLRSRLAFDGLVVSDDLSMAGAETAGDVVARAKAAFDAGCDAALVCNSPHLVDQLIAGLPIAQAVRDPQSLARRLEAMRGREPWVTRAQLQACAEV